MDFLQRKSNQKRSFVQKNENLRVKMDFLCKAHGGISESKHDSQHFEPLTSNIDQELIEMDPRKPILRLYGRLKREKQFLFCSHM